MMLYKDITTVSEMTGSGCRTSSSMQILEVPPGTLSFPLRRQLPMPSLVQGDL
jgi:hypothetical protein